MSTSAMRSDLAALLFLGSLAIALGLSIEPNHDKPCIVGDAWAEECMSCVCVEGRVASCRPTLCASRLRRALDHCKEGEVTRVDCNTCVCKNNKRVCSKKKCKKGATLPKKHDKSKKARVASGKKLQYKSAQEVPPKVRKRHE